MRLRVSDLDAWVRYIEPEREEFEVSTEEFLAYMRRESSPTVAMNAGSAFHSILERAQPGDDLDNVNEGGFRFTFADDMWALTVPRSREEDVAGTYPTPSGPVLLRGRVDGREGIEVTDYKLTLSTFDAERYAGSLQWRAYLDLSGAKRFRYLVFQGKLKGSDVWVHEMHELIFWAYPEMHEDVSRRVGELASFVARHVPALV